MTDWPVKTLGDICRIEMGRTPSRGDSKGWDQSFKTTNHWASIADLTACSGRVLTSTKERISDFAAKTTKVVPAGTLMMSFKLSIGKLAFAGCDLYTNEAIAAFHLHDQSEIDSEFLYWALSVVDWSALTKGSEKVKGATMNKAKLNLLEIPVPPLEEQKRIVELLDDATSRVTELTACYERARNHANNLFTSALREALDSNSDWPIKTLGEVCQIEMGRTPSRGESKGWDKELKTSNHWASIADLTACRGRVLSSTKERISDFAARTTKVVPAGTLMMSFKLSIGKLAFAGCDLYTNEAIAAFHLPEQSDVDSEFLYWALKVVDWASLTKGSEKVKGATMNKAKLNLLEIPVPPLEEQKRIVATLGAIEAKTSEMVSAYDKKLTAAKNLRQSILEAAFAGEL